jgi:hypothetical protein
MAKSGRAARFMVAKSERNLSVAHTVANRQPGGRVVLEARLWRDRWRGGFALIPRRVRCS